MNTKVPIATSPALPVGAARVPESIELTLNAGGLIFRRTLTLKSGATWADVRALILAAENYDLLSWGCGIDLFNPTIMGGALYLYDENRREFVIAEYGPPELDTMEIEPIELEGATAFYEDDTTEELEV
ncbi:MAG: hypothetical protein IPM18_00140 [Phycisphaerales bacterium]|nr:hypothetical protein [Phycisphaerales bacterium]